MAEDEPERDDGYTWEIIIDDRVKCVCCGKMYEINSWNFYNLCDPCFKVFDAQKMRVRWALAGQVLVGGKFDPTELPAGTESVDEFVKAGVCPHK